MLDIREKAVEIVGLANTLKGENFPVNHILEYKTIPFRGGTVLYKFKVRSSQNVHLYTTEIIMKERKILSAACTCPQYEIDGKCKHIAAVLYAHESLLFEEKAPNQELILSEKILSSLSPTPINTLTKKRVFIELEIFFESSYYNSGLFVKLKLGMDKTYVLGNKMAEFFRVFSYGEGEVYFGKQFTYTPSHHYFTKEDEEVIRFLAECFFKNGKYYGGLIFVGEHFLTEFLHFLQDRDFVLGNKGVFHSIYFENPFHGKLFKKGDLYQYVLEEDPYQMISKYPEYIIKDHKLYVLPTKVAELLLSFQKYKMNSLTFTGKDLSKFVKGIFPYIQNETEIASGLEREVLLIEPLPQLYFDMEEGITCTIHFDYNGEVISYFKTAPFLRNEEFEEEVVRYIMGYHFILDKDTLLLKDPEQMGHFLEEDLFEISKKYPVFTSQKLKDTNIIKNTHISSQFSIGKDNIMSYAFDLEGIDPGEIGDIFKSMKQKKKYYRLKSGQILDIEKNESLEEFQNLATDLDLSARDMESGSVTIPKYQAIYLDSLKRTKYQTIRTNNLFDALIENFNAYKDAEIKLGEEDQKILRPYQTIGVKWLYTIYKCGFGGILADEMGLGKSVQLICFIKEVLKEKKDAKFLIVAPTSLIYNWENEFQKFGRELSFKVIAEGKNKRMQSIQENRDTNIFITTYGLVRQDASLYEEMLFECIILDEAQNIKNPSSGISKVVKKLNGNAKFALTGTPIENTVMELWSIFDFIMPGYLTSLQRFQAKYNTKDIEDEKNLFDDLNMQIDAFILRRKKEDVAKDLPSKIENNIYLDLTLEQKKVYVSQLEQTKEEMDALIEKEGFLKSRFKILELLTRLRQICIDPRIVFDNYTGESAKIENVVSLTKDIIKNGHKILLFTSFRTALAIVKDAFTKEGITSYVIDGSVSSKKRAELVDQFNEDDTNVFLIMLKAGGTGLNLTGADVVIHLDLWWNPQAENQATDRAHRIGQTKTVEVIKLICKGTIEEKILELQNKKKKLSDILIDGDIRDENKFSALDEEEIRKLLSFDV